MAQTSFRSLVGVFVSAVLIVAAATPAFAQEPAQTEPEAAQQEQVAMEGERPVVVKEIVVTAQKREQDVQEVPVSISTISSEDLDVITTGGPDVRALSGRVPSLILESSFGRAFPRFYIRGLGNTDFDLNASQPVSMIVDEVVLENPIVKGMPLFDLDRVEVLRGPQGTLFGRNTPAGIVKFETVKPSQEFDATFRASYGTYNTIDINGGVGGRLTDTLSARFSGLYQSQSDWVDNVHTGENDALGGYETIAWRGQLLWEPNDAFSALVNLHGWEINDGTARLFRGNIIEPGGGLVDWFAFDEVYFDGLNSQDMSSMGGVLRLEYDFGEATLTAITGYESIDDMYSRGDIDGGFGASFAPPYGPGFIPFYSETADGIPNLDQWTQEVRVASNGNEKLDWLVGAFYFTEDFRAETFSYNSLAPGNPKEAFAFQTQDATSYALFASLDFHLSAEWELKAGLRYTSDEKDFAAERPEPMFFNTVTIAPVTANTDADNVSWDVSALYKASDTLNLYGRVATGFRAPSIQGRILFAPDTDGGTNPETDGLSVADSEEILSFEAGFKSILAESRLRLNMTAYWYEISDQQITAVGGLYNIATLYNADSTEGYGLEADIEWTPSGNWLTTFGFSYNPTKINDRNLTVSGCASGCTMTDPIAPNGERSLDGNSLPHAPEIILNGIVNWRSDPVAKGFFGTLDFSYYSERQFFLYESPEYEDDALEVGLRIGYGWHQGTYEVALWGRNIFDEEILRGGIDFNNLTGYVNDPGRLIGVEFAARF